MTKSMVLGRMTCVGIYTSGTRAQAQTQRTNSDTMQEPKVFLNYCLNVGGTAKADTIKCDCLGGWGR